jgi:choline dehydrogenase-like flavoprotein
LTILSGREVEALEFDGDNRCVGARAGGERFEASRGVILAAGAIGSPALMLRAGIGPADELRAVGVDVRHDLPGVGRNLHDHLLSGGNVYAAKRPVPPSNYQHSESLMYLGGDDRAPNLVLACVVLPVVTECFDAPPEGYTIMFGFTHPKSRGSIRLTSAAPNAPLAIDPNYLAHEDDRQAYLDALDAARTIGADPAFDAWRAAEILPGEDVQTEAEKLAFLERAAFTHHHPVGTCRMGEGREAVVDTDLAVHGVPGLYLVDASVMPRITTGPVNAAVIAIAERASDLLRERMPLPPRHIPVEC